MSSVRMVVGLLVCIAAVVAAHFAIDVSTVGAPRALRRHTLAPAAEKSAEFAIARAGEAVTRLRMGLDGVWSVESPFVARADQRAVLRLADALAFSPISDEMTEAELLRLGRTRADFGLDNPRMVVTVGEPGRGETVVSFGAATPDGDGVYATVGKSDTVYVVSSNVCAAVDRGVMGFRCRNVFSVEAENVSSFDVKGCAGRFLRIAREGDVWKLVEPYENVVSSSRVGAFLAAVAALEARDFVWPTSVSNEISIASASLLAGYGLDTESAVTVTLKCLDGKEHIASFGRESGKGLVYALVQGGSAIVTVPDAVREFSAVGAFVDTRLFPLEKAGIGVISLDDGTSSYLLSRGSDDVWRLDAPVSAVADQAVAKSLEEQVLSLRLSDVAADGVKVSVGTNAEPVVVSRKAILTGFRLEDLRSKEILRVDPKQMKRIVVTDGGKKPVAVVFDAEKGVWSVESAEDAVAADDESIAKLCLMLGPLKASYIARLKVSMSELVTFGLDKPFRTIAIDQTEANSVRRNILIGNVTDGGRFATLGSSDAVFVISSESASALLAPIAK